MTEQANESPLRKLTRFGQSVWLDYIDRNLIRAGQLKTLVEQDGISGVTSNPSIFEKAITGSNVYDQDIAAMVGQGKSAVEIYEALTIQDVQEALDILRDVYDSTGGQDGFVSLEVSPHLARDTQGTINEARRLFKAVDRPNLLIKIPGTVEGLPAIRQCLSEGININITLLFGLDRYRQVGETYIQGLEDAAAAGMKLGRIASVASFFLSRIDVLLDPELEKLMANDSDPKARTARSLRGQTAIASAKVAYQIYQEIFTSDRFAKLAKNGAVAQRLLWASTSTKNPDYVDTMYVEPLIGPHTVNTLPTATVEAYRDHGRPASRLEGGTDEAANLLARLPEVGIDLDTATEQLEQEGIDKFIKPYDNLLNSLRAKGASG